MGSQNHLRTFIQGITDSGQGSFNSGAICNPPLCQRHVEIYPDEDALVLEVQLIDHLDVLGHCCNLLMSE